MTSRIHKLSRSILTLVLVSLPSVVYAQPAPADAGEHGMSPAPRDTQQIARDLPPGTLVVSVRDQNGQPRARQPVKLRVRRQSPAIGEKVEILSASSDIAGQATFSNLQTVSEYAYAAEIPFEGAVYGTEYANFQAGAGLRFTVHTFPTTRSLEAALVAMGGIVAIEPSASVLKLEVAIDIVNVGRVTWLPERYVIHLPTGAKAFEPWERTTGRDAVDEGTLRFEQQGPVAALVGTARPGQHRTGFRFQLPNPGFRFLPWAQSDVARFEFGLPQRVTRLTVFSDKAPGMRLVVPGFPDATVSDGPEGRPVLATTWEGSSLEDHLPGLTVTLSGVRTRGSMPFLAVAATLGLLVWGCFGLRFATGRGPVEEDVTEARERLLGELWALEQALATGKIGPKTHAAARRAIVAALARLEQPPSPKKKKKAQRPKRSRRAHPARRPSASR